VHPQVIEHYTRVGRPFSVNFAGPAIPFLQIEPRGVPLASIISGRDDSWLRSYARAVARYGKPVILGFAPEMNGTWYSWGYTHVQPSVYIAAWRHVVTVFRSQHARNVTWIWTVNIERITTDHPSPAVSAISPWWPGRAYVTWVGIDGYYFSAAQHFGALFGPTIIEARKLTSQPVLISESAASPSAGKAAKIPDLYTGARTDKLAGVIWFDLNGNQNWTLDTPAAITAFRRAARLPGGPRISGPQPQQHAGRPAEPGPPEPGRDRQ
jgi:glycosyl hydrolase family 26